LRFLELEKIPLISVLITFSHREVSEATAGIPHTATAYQHKIEPLESGGDSKKAHRDGEPTPKKRLTLVLAGSA
jgi:hypothetical protein